jgi:hypothetical protein
MLSMNSTGLRRAPRDNRGENAESSDGLRTAYASDHEQQARQLSQSKKMKVLRSIFPAFLFAGTSLVSAASSWSFEDATVAVQAKGAGVGAGPKEK